MKAFWTSVAAAILIAVVAAIVLEVGLSSDSQDVYQSTHGSVRL